MLTVSLKNFQGQTALRRSPEDRAASLRQRKEEIEKQLAGLEAREREAKRKLDTRRKVIVGGAVLAHAERDPAFAAKLGEVLSHSVLRDFDRKAVADLLPSAIPMPPPSGAETDRDQAPSPELRTGT